MAAREDEIKTQHEFHHRSKSAGIFGCGCLPLRVSSMIMYYIYL